MNTPPEGIADLLQGLIDNGVALEKEVNRICIYSKGSVNRDQVFRMSYKERKVYVDILKDYLSEQ